jgi:hypothetical protein
LFGKPCHLARSPVKIAVFDRAGDPVRLLVGVPDEKPSTFIEGDFTHRFERLLNIGQLARCDLSNGQRGPFTVAASVGETYVERQLTGDEVGCWLGG